jgi:hypothetical protein
MTEWNEWRKKNPNEDILLEGAELKGAYLKGAYLKGAYLEGAKLQNAVLWEAKLQRANLRETFLQRAELIRANIQGAEFGGARLQGADFSRAIVDGETLIWRCEVDRKTKFEGVALGNVRIYPAEKQLLECNVRQMNWEAWYKYKDWHRRIPEEERKMGYKVVRWPVQWFWALSDYGRSTGRILLWFCILAFVFALIYWVWGLAEPPGVVSNLFELEGTRKGVFTYELIDMTRIERQPGEPVKIGKGTAFVRALYFSVVTQTTLGFGDMYANAQRIWGHVLLSLQVILGYVLLGALVTRFAVLFTAGGPAGKFSKKEKGEGAAGR